MDEERGLAGKHEAESEPAGAPLATVLYSARRDIYRVPSARSDLWLSVQVYSMQDSGSLLWAPTADGRAWRRAYRGWTTVQPGAVVTLPADDPLVADYLRQTKAEEL